MRCLWRSLIRFLDTYYGIAVWTAVELDVATISACLPTLRPVIEYVASFFRRCYWGRSHTRISDVGDADGLGHSKEPRGPADELGSYALEP